MNDSVSGLHTRPSLLVRIRDPQDADSWRAFAETYAPLVYNHGRRQGLQDADAADVTQEVLAEVARSVRAFEYQPERGRFRDWLWIVTHRKLARFLDRRGRRLEAGPGDSDEPLGQAPAPSADWNADFHAQVLRVAMERARPHFEATSWAAFERTWLTNQPAAQVARDLAVPIETVYLAKSRVLKRLEDEVRNLAEDIPQCVPLG